MSVRVQIVHVWEAHVSVLGFVAIFCNIQLAIIITRVVFREGRKRNDFISACRSLETGLSLDIIFLSALFLLTVIIDVVETLRILSKLRSKEFFDCLYAPDLDARLRISILLLNRHFLVYIRFFVFGHFSTGQGTDHFLFMFV